VIPSGALVFTFTNKNQNKMAPTSGPSNFTGSLAASIVVIVIVAALVGGLILLVALRWRELLKLIAPNKFAAAESEQASDSAQQHKPTMSTVSSEAASVLEKQPVTTETQSKSRYLPSMKELLPARLARARASQ
jgi:hypothetical protein